MARDREGRIDWGREAQNYGPRITNWGWRMYNQPSSVTAGSQVAAESAGPSLASESTVAGTSSGAGTAAGAAAGESSLSGLGGASWSAYAPYLSVIAPLLATYSAYTAGSGVNEPLRKQYETAGLGKLLIDLADGKKVDPKDTYKYGIKPKLLDPTLDPTAYRDESGMPAHGFETVDPRGYDPAELYDAMHRYGSGHYQTGGVGNSGLNDQQIDERFGEDKGKVATLLGYSQGLPDWSGKRYDDNNNPYFNEPSMNREKTLSDRAASLTELEKGDILNRNRTRMGLENAPAGQKEYQEMLKYEQDVAEIEKLLGYSIRRNA